MSAPSDHKLKSTMRLPLVLHGPGASDFLQTVKRDFHLEDIVSLEIVDQAFEDGDTLLYLAFSRELQINGQELGDANGIYALLGGNLTLRFDKSGQLSSYELEDAGQADVEAEKKGVLDLIRRKQIYFAKPGETVNVGKLVSDQKRFYVEVGKDGRKRLKRTATI